MDTPNEGMVDIHFLVPRSYRDALDKILPDGKMRSLLLRRLLKSYVEEYVKGTSPDSITEAAKIAVERMRREGIL